MTGNSKKAPAGRRPVAGRLQPPEQAPHQNIYAPRTGCGPKQEVAKAISRLAAAQAYNFSGALGNIGQTVGYPLQVADYFCI